MIEKIFNNLKQRSRLIKAFKLAGIYRTYKTDTGERKIFPKIHNVPNEKYDYFYFSLPNGVEPKLLKRNFYVFQQVFGQGVQIEGDYKNFKLSIKAFQKIPKIDYDFESIKQIIRKQGIIFPIVAGGNEYGELSIYDATPLPNLLIYGEPGSGKSSILHVILSTLIQYFKSEELELILADFKMSELNFYEGVAHVKSVSYFEKELAPALAYIKRELRSRGQLLKDNKVRHVNKLPEDQKPPYIVLCIDEFVSIRNDETMADLLEIASLGRAYGIYVILSMQRPSHKILSTDVRGLLSVRMGFRTVDKRNAMIGETPGSELIPAEGAEGTFMLKMNDLKQLRSPYLNEDATEKLLEPFKVVGWKNHSYFPQKPKGEKQQQGQLTDKDVFADASDKP